MSLSGTVLYLDEKMRGKGTYSLIIYLRSPVKVRIGALGVWGFSRGYYIYVGSALRGIRERVERHLHRAKRPYWHIDHLLASEEALVVSVITAETVERAECIISASIGAIPGARVVVEGFGSSDCGNCRSHLYYFASRPYRKLVGEVREAYRESCIEPHLIANINQPPGTPKRSNLKA